MPANEAEARRSREGRRCRRERWGCAARLGGVTVARHCLHDPN